MLEIIPTKWCFKLKQNVSMVSYNIVIIPKDKNNHFSRESEIFFDLRHKVFPSMPG